MNRSDWRVPTITLALALAAPAFAQRQQAVGPGITPLSPTGSRGRGVPGGPATDILTSNNLFVAGPVAVSTSGSGQGNIVFNSGSTVCGAIAVTQPGGPFRLAISARNTASQAALRTTGQFQNLWQPA